LFTRARAALAYDEASKRLILGFKNADRTDTAPTLAAWMARAGQALLADADLLAPVPLHWTRLFLRRYNQSALLAHGIGRLVRVPVVADLLVRYRRTRKLGNFGRAERQKIVKGAISVVRRHSRRVRGQRIVLIDDVLTTGATVNDCSRALLAAGAARVDVLALARVLRPER
jgi:ComF family protein